MRERQRPKYTGTGIKYGPISPDPKSARQFFVSWQYSVPHTVAVRRGGHVSPNWLARPDSLDRIMLAATPLQTLQT